MKKNKLYNEIYEELGNLAEFGEQESATNNILKMFEKRIDDLIEDVDELLPRKKYQEAKNVLLHLKKMLK